MSKIGQKSIEVPNGSMATIKDGLITVKGPKGEMSVNVPRELTIEQEGNIINIKRSSDVKHVKSLHGLYRQLVYNAVSGVVKPHEIRLEVVGTGFNVKLQGEDLVFKLGFSHPVVFKKVPGITFMVDGNTKVIVLGVDKQLVGQVAYQIKILRKPDVYKGKGIRYEGEKLRIKPGKKAKAAGAAQ